MESGLVGVSRSPLSASFGLGVQGATLGSEAKLHGLAFSMAQGGDFFVSARFPPGSRWVINLRELGVIYGTPVSSDW